MSHSNLLSASRSLPRSAPAAYSWLSMGPCAPTSCPRHAPGPAPRSRPRTSVQTPASSLGARLSPRPWARPLPSAQSLLPPHTLRLAQRRKWLRRGERGGKAEGGDPTPPCSRRLLPPRVTPSQGRKRRRRRQRRRPSEGCISRRGSFSLVRVARGSGEAPAARDGAHCLARARRWGARGSGGGRGSGGVFRVTAMHKAAWLGCKSSSCAALLARVGGERML